MSKQDTHFFNTFSAIIAVLIVAALLIFAMARWVADRTQVKEVYEDPKYVASTEERIRPFVREAVAGKDNSAMQIQAAPQGAGVALAVPKDGPALYEAGCKTCHATGLVGAPKFGDHAAWAPRIAKGKATLYEHALKGFTGTVGVMPAKGGRTDLTDELIRSGVDYLVSKGQ